MGQLVIRRPEVVLLMRSQVPYPLISLVTRQPQTLNGSSPLSFNTRTFESFTFSFDKDSEALDVFDSVKELTVASKHSSLHGMNNE